MLQRYITLLQKAGKITVSTLNFEAFSISAILRILKLIMHQKRIFQSIIQNHITKCEKYCFSGSCSLIPFRGKETRKHWCNYGVNHRQQQLTINTTKARF